MFPTLFRTSIAAGVILASTVAAFADIMGDFYAYGRNPDGSAYSGTVEIIDNGNGTVTVEWSVGSEYSGVGILSGDVLTVEWGADDRAFYIVMPDGELHGTWADGTGLELLSRTER
ncbi:hypothetical protein [Hasllibacter sp. MH4015]|uniref:hypothetical protein n=1 Tax=Hasllibacter sp. MH4015 TaxID=2854029 RepID=UPI001CD2F3A1|nr:hypothetical protein [Hasllibacter sp. MH4015]